MTTGLQRSTQQRSVAVANWTVAVYRKLDGSQSSFQSYDSVRPVTPTLHIATFYVQLQQQSNSSSPSRSDVLHFRYNFQKNNNNVYTTPFTVTPLNNFNLTPETAQSSTAQLNSNQNMNTSSAVSSKFYNYDQAVVRINDSNDSSPVLLLQAKAFLGTLIVNDPTNYLYKNHSGVSLAFMIFVVEDAYVGQLFDAHIYRIVQVTAVSLRNHPEDEQHISGIKKLFQGRCFYYSSYAKIDGSQQRKYFENPYDITLCAQRMMQGHESDNRFYWNRTLCLPLLKFNIDIRYWIPKVMCGGIEAHRSRMDNIDLWLISRLSCERAGTRFNVRGVNDDGAVGNFVETEQIVVQFTQGNYSSFVMIRGSIPLFWHQPRFQVGTHRITISRSEALSFRAFFEHFKYLYRQYGRVFILNLVEKRGQEGSIGEKYMNLFFLLAQIYRKTTRVPSSYGYLTEKDFIWFEYHEQSRTIKNLPPETFVQQLLIENSQYPIGPAIQTQGFLTFMDGSICDIQKGVFRVNCIDCLDRTNNVQLSIGLHILLMQLESLKIRTKPMSLRDQLKTMWINNGDHISRIYTGTGALGQRSLAKDIQRSVGRAIQNNLRDDDKQQSMETLIFTFSKDSFLHECAAVNLFTPYTLSDGLVLTELQKIRQRFVRKERFRVSIGTWNINGDKNPALNDSYRPILDAWIFDGPDNLINNRKTDGSIPTIGYLNRNYTKTMPHILAIGFQEICDLTASNMVSASSANAERWVRNVQDHFKCAHSKDEYILLENDQLVGVCLALFVRRDIAPFIKNVAVESVKTGMGGRLGNKGCVAIRFILHNTSLCFICAHFTAGQNEVNERNKDFRTIIEKLSFSPPSRALWHDHIFFLGDFNYRLNVGRSQIYNCITNGDYTSLLQKDQLTNQLEASKVFYEFSEGPILFPPTYKYDIGLDQYDSSEKARIPSYTDRILWRSLSANARAELLYYGRAEVKTSDHRPVNALFDVEIEICDETLLRREYMGTCERLKPSNALVAFDMRASVAQRKYQLLEEVVFYCNQKYGTNIVIVERFFLISQDYLSLYVFFENGEQARRVMEPVEDQFTSGVYFRKRLVDANDSIALIQRFGTIFPDTNQTMYPESLNFDLGTYQTPERESLSTVQQTGSNNYEDDSYEQSNSNYVHSDIVHENVNNEDSSSIRDQNGNYQSESNLQLISFDADSSSLSNSRSQPVLQQTPARKLSTSQSNPFQLSLQNSSQSKESEVDNLLSFEPVSDTGKSKFYIDIFDELAASANQSTSTKSLTLPTSTSSNNNNQIPEQSHHLHQPHLNNKFHHPTHGHHFLHGHPQPAHQISLPPMAPTRPAPPPPINAFTRSISEIQKPLSLQELSLNSNQNRNGHQNKQSDDLLDLGDPGSPPPSPTFDPLR